MALWARQQARREQEARLATVRAILARAAAEEEGRTVSEILTRASKAETAYPPAPSRHVWVGTGERGAPWAMLSL
jgi:hypothetical protein